MNDDVFPPTVLLAIYTYLIVIICTQMSLIYTFAALMSRGGIIVLLQFYTISYTQPSPPVNIIISMEMIDDDVDDK